MTAVSFTVYGVAQPAGSKRAFVSPKTGRAHVTDAAKGSRAWKQEVRSAAIHSLDGEPAPQPCPLLDGPLSLAVTIYLPRPQGHYGSRGLRPSAPTYPTVRPDVTKLLRGIEDALTGIIWRDDAQIVYQKASKHYGEPARVEVTVVPGAGIVSDRESAATDRAGAVSGDTRRGDDGGAGGRLPAPAVPTAAFSSGYEILDACCGGRMWWWDKAHLLAVYVDKRTRPQGTIVQKPLWKIEPDVLADFRALPFSDGSFQLVLFDPPHQVRSCAGTGINAEQYGAWDDRGERDETLRLGLAECWRVLAPGGTLIFKWAGRVADVQAAFPAEPVVGTRPRGRRDGPAWVVFYKPLEEVAARVAV